MLSEQLREMTTVLEEFDTKYSRKEAQLKESTKKNAHMKDTLAQLKILQNETVEELGNREQEI